MSLRVPSAVAVAAALVLATGCGPEDATSDDTSRTSPATVSSPGSSQEATPEVDGTPVDNRAYDYVCSRLTASEVSASLGEQFTATPESVEMSLPEDMAHCTYRVSQNTWFTVDYLSVEKWDVHEGLADRNESGYSHQPDGSIVVKGPMGSAYIMRDDNGMMLNVAEFGVVGVVGEAKFDAFRKTLPDQID